MKIMHTADLHLGKIVNEMSMLEDQVYILNEIKHLLQQEQPDVLIIAGDLYDRSVPPARAVDVLNDFLNDVVVEMKVPILAIAGNHDSGERLDFASGILKKQGLHIGGVLKDSILKATLADEAGKVDFYLIPYIEPAVARHVFGEEEIRTHEDAMVYVVRKIKETHNPNHRSVIVAHGYVTFMSEEAREGKSREEIMQTSELEISDSERPLSIGGTDLISGKVFEGFHYVALGHLHGPQKVGSDRIRYSGSPLKYSFSEEKQKKSVTIVNLDAQGHVDISLRPLNPIRDMRTIVGTMEDILRSASGINHREDYVFVTLMDDGEVFEPMAKLRSVYPNVMGVRRGNNTSLPYQQIKHEKENQPKNTVELFHDFYENVSQRTFDENRRECVTKVIACVEKEEV